jgi:hypothetical protein
VFQFSVSRTSERFLSPSANEPIAFRDVLGMVTATNYKAAKKLLDFIHRGELKILSSRPRSLKVSKDDCPVVVYGFSGLTDRRTATFIKNVISMRPYMESLSNKDFLQMVIDCSMACYECMIECSQIQDNEMARAAYNLNRKTAYCCFNLAKDFIQNHRCSGYLLLSCEKACKENLSLCKKYTSKKFKDCKALCELCAASCRNEYQKVVLN